MEGDKVIGETLSGGALDDGAVIVVHVPPNTPAPAVDAMRDDLRGFKVAYKARHSKDVSFLIFGSDVSVSLLGEPRAPSASSRLWVELPDGDLVCLEVWGHLCVDQDDYDNWRVQVYRWVGPGESESINLTDPLTRNQADAALGLIRGAINTGVPLIYQSEIKSLLEVLATDVTEEQEGAAA